MNSESKPLRSCTVFGVDFTDEAKDVAAIFETKPLLDATKNQVLENLNSDILHFSCHGFFNYKDSISSGIELKDDILHASEIFNLNLKSKLVTLSACETGVNENKSGDELIGISRALIYAGASSLVVSLWSVSGYTTKDLMRLFYSNIKHGYGIAVALQKAQVKLRDELIERYGTDGSNPFFWAAFVLIGGKFGH
jgi:CHAT domain-containing protein